MTDSEQFRCRVLLLEDITAGVPMTVPQSHLARKAVVMVLIVFRKLSVGMRHFAVDVKTETDRVGLVARPGRVPEHVLVQRPVCKRIRFLKESNQELN